MSVNLVMGLKNGGRAPPGREDGFDALVETGTSVVVVFSVVDMSAASVVVEEETFLLICCTAAPPPLLGRI